MSRKPLHHALAPAEPPTTRVRRISDDDAIDAVDRDNESSNEPSAAFVEPRAVVALDADCSYSVDFDETR